MDTKDYILVQQIMDDGDCKFLLHSLVNSPFWRAKTLSPNGESVEDSDRTNYSFSISANPDLAIIDAMLFRAFGKAVSEYVTKFPKCYVNSDEGYEVLRYEVGQEYKEHVDSGIDKHRTISAILYVNDNYEGGELEFPELGLSFKPKAGEIILFPSNFCYVHKSTPVTLGTKYSVVTWFK